MCFHLCDGRLLSLDSAMLLKELIEQHRVHLVVADAVGLSFLITHDEIGIHPLHVLGYNSQLTFACRINLFLVTEGDWLERKERFAIAIHWLNTIFEALGRSNRAKLAIGIDKHAGAVGGCHTKNVTDVTGVTHVLALHVCADADHVIGRRDAKRCRIA